MENQDNNKAFDGNQAQDLPGGPDERITNADLSDDQASLATDGPVSKSEGDGTSPDLNDTTKETNADEPNYGGDTSKSFDRDQEEINLGLNDGDLDTDVPDEQK